MKSRVHPTYKIKYRVANWASYDRALVRRGDVTVWFSPEAIATWTPPGGCQRGGQRQYSDLAIETALTLRLLFHLPLRQTEGFLTSIFGMLGLDPLRARPHDALTGRCCANRNWPARCQPTGPSPAADADLGGDLIRAEAGAGGQRHRGWA